MTFNGKNRLLSLDILKIIAIFFVIVLHITDPVLKKFGTIPFSWWLSSNFYESLAMIAVPLFIVTSGLLLLDKTEPLQVFLRKRAKRILLPWIGWTMIYFLWEACAHGAPAGLPTALNLLADIFFNYFWFMPLITGIYILTPLLRMVLKKIPNNVIILLLSFWFLTASAKFMVVNSADMPVVVTSPSNPLFLLLLSVPYCGYFVTGFGLGRLRTSVGHHTMLFLTYLVSLFVTFFGTYTSSRAGGSVDFRYLSHFAPNLILQTVTFAGLFSLSPQRIPVSSKLHPLIVTLSNAILGVYLSNRLMTDVVTHGVLGYKLDVLTFHPIVSIPIIGLVIFALSFLLVYGLQKVPILKHFIA